MKIKSVENFSLEECREYLDTNPESQYRAAVEERLKELKENKSKHKPEPIDVKRTNIRQFKDDNEKCFRQNPFKEKSLEDFTIVDCESYLSRYPYGEHILEVKAHLKKLKSTVAKILFNLTQDVKKLEQSQVIQKKPQEKNKHKKPKTKPQVSYNNHRSQCKNEARETFTKTNDDKDIYIILGVVVIVILLYYL